MVKGIFKPAYNGFYSKINEQHWVCEVCGEEFLGGSPHSWTMCNEHEIDCKIKTRDIVVEESEKPYLVDQGCGSRLVKFRAHRSSRPNVNGYGMTESEASNDLTRNVQPLH